MKTICACVVCLVVGVMIGRVLAPQAMVELKNKTENESSVRKGTRYASSQGQAGDRSVQRNRSDTGALELAGDSGLKDPNRDGKLVVVPASLIGHLSQAAAKRTLAQNLFSQNGEMEKYLQISDREKSRVQQAWRATQKEMRQYENNAAETEDLTDESVKITVPDMSLAMKGFGDDFQETVQETLGENRADAFIQMKQIDQILTPTEGDKVYTVKVEAIGDGRWRYHMSFESVDGRRVWVGESVPEEIRHITDAAKINPELNPAEEEEE